MRVTMTLVTLLFFILGILLDVSINLRRLNSNVKKMIK